MPNKTIHKEEGKKSVISISDFNNEGLHVFPNHGIEWDLSRFQTNKTSLKIFQKKLGIEHGVISSLTHIHPHFDSSQATSYKEWLASKIPINKELKNIELLSQFKIFINIVKSSLIQKKYLILDVYINSNALKALFIVNEEYVTNDDFINLFYDLAFKHEEEFRKRFKKEINLSFLGHDDIDQNELKIDKFFKLKDGK